MEHKIKVTSSDVLIDGKETLCFEISEDDDLQKAFRLVDAMQEKQRIWEIAAKPYKEKRSLSANAYLWVLCDKIANEISTREEKPVSKEDVYRQAIHNVGSFDVVTLKSDAVDTFIKHWKNNGTGWICEELNNYAGYVDVACYYGSSTYNQKEMARLLDEVIADAKALGIETATPEQLAEMKALWGAENV